MYRDGVTLACPARGGTGPPVLMLHGLAGSADEITATLDGLSPGYRVLSWDQRGHGRSTRRPAGVTRDAHASDAVAVIEHLAREPVTLVGESLGGHTAMLVAARRPDLVTSLVVAEASPERDPDVADEVRS